MEAEPSAPQKPTMASIQKDIDVRMFAKTPIHIIERYLDSFATDGSMAFEVPQHILEALAVRLRAFMAPSSSIRTLDQAFDGQVARQRQARVTADLQFAVAFDVYAERQEMRKLKPSQRGRRTPYEMACINVAKKRKMSVDNVRRLYKDSKVKKPPIVG